MKFDDEKATYEGPIRLVNECISDLYQPRVTTDEMRVYQEL
jgi:hypothetical protein